MMPFGSFSFRIRNGRVMRGIANYFSILNQRELWKVAGDGVVVRGIASNDGAWKSFRTTMGAAGAAVTHFVPIRAVGQTMENAMTAGRVPTPMRVATAPTAVTAANVRHASRC